MINKKEYKNILKDETYIDHKEEYVYLKYTLFERKFLQILNFIISFLLVVIIIPNDQIALFSIFGTLIFFIYNYTVDIKFFNKHKKVSDINNDIKLFILIYILFTVPFTLIMYFAGLNSEHMFLCYIIKFELISAECYIFYKSNYKKANNNEELNLRLKYKTNIKKLLINNIFREEPIFKSEEDYIYNRKIFDEKNDPIIVKDIIELKNNNLVFAKMTNFSPGHHFKGIIVKFDLEKNINQSIAIKSNPIREFNDVDIDDHYFEKYFNVKCDDKIFALNLLTIDITQDIVDLRKKVNFDIGLENDKGYVRIYSDIDYYEFSEILEDYNEAKKYFNAHEDMLKVVKILSQHVRNIVKKM